MKAGYLFISLTALLAFSCAGAPEPSTETQEAAPVQEQQIQPRQQQKVLVSKGVILSANEVEVFSRIEGQLLDVKLLEGRTVRKGETLFNLDDWELAAKVQISRTAYEQASFRMTEILLGQGYKRDKLDEVPENIKEYARIKSGLNVSASELSYNQERLKKAVITAPVSGVVTLIKALPYSFVKPGETLCTIVDPANLIVRFSILETELRKFSVGTEVEVRSIAYPEMIHIASVRSIGTVVDESGMVEIEAVLSDSEKLLPGMTAMVNL